MVVICFVGVDFNGFSKASYCLLPPAKFSECSSKFILVNIVVGVNLYGLCIVLNCQPVHLSVKIIVSLLFVLLRYLIYIVARITGT